MSYCRFWWDGSDVYVYESDQGFECCGCKLSHSWTHQNRRAMVAHLMDHLEEGHFVPRHALDSLLDEIYAEIKIPKKPRKQLYYEKQFKKAVEQVKKK